MGIKPDLEWQWNEMAKLFLGYLTQVRWIQAATSGIWTPSCRPTSQKTSCLKTSPAELEMEPHAVLWPQGWGCHPGGHEGPPRDSQLRVWCQWTVQANQKDSPYWTTLDVHVSRCHNRHHLCHYVCAVLLLEKGLLQQKVCQQHHWFSRHHFSHLKLCQLTHLSLYTSDCALYLKDILVIPSPLRAWRGVIQCFGLRKERTWKISVQSMCFFISPDKWTFLIWSKL